MVGSGIPGPVEIIGRKGDESIVKDLSHHKWSYKVGLNGFTNHFFDPNNKYASQWLTDDLPIHKKMIWYKTTFKAPLGDDPVAVDMQGLGKGEAWVNGNSIGRYWPSYITAEEGCPAEPCDYRGPYFADKCTSNCGKPTQRWYHVPRSFIANDDVNELVVFEEMGGNPSLVNFVTVREGIVCGSAYQNKYMELSCQGRTISDIKFASFGHVKGHSCPSYQIGTCESQSDALAIVKNACLGKETCSIQASESVFGATNCGQGISKRLVVQAVC